MKSVLLIVAFDMGIDLQRREQTVSSPIVADLMRTYPHTQLTAQSQVNDGYWGLGVGKNPGNLGISQAVGMPLGRVIAEKGLSQRRIYTTGISEGVTFYFDGGRSSPFPQCDYLLVSNADIDRQVIESVYGLKYSFILAGLETPNKDSSSDAEFDKRLFRIVNAALASGVVTILTAAYSSIFSYVPFIVIHDQLFGQATVMTQGSIADVAPSILHFLSIAKPKDMSGNNLCGEIHVVN